MDRGSKADATKTVTLSIYDIRPNLRIINLYPCEPGFDSKFRRLYAHYFLYVHKGKGIIIIGDKQYNAISGDLFYCPPATPNRIIADDKDPFLLTGIDFDFTLNHRSNNILEPIQAELFKPSYVTEYIGFSDFEGFWDKVSLPGDTTIRELIYQMVQQFNSQKRYWDHYVNGVLQGFIVTIIQRMTQKKSQIINPVIGDEIISYLAQNYMKDLTYQCIADRFHYHPGYINKIVFSYTGLTLKQYVIDIRIRTALNYLMNTDMELNKIASSVGYDNIHYFFRIFKKKTGYPPSHFKSLR